MPSTNYDAVVVGGGIVGTSVGWSLARRGLRTLVADRADAGGATNAGAGIVCPVAASVDSPAVVELAFEGAAYYRRLVAALGGEGLDTVGYRSCGLLSFGLGGRDVTEVARMARWGDALAARYGVAAAVETIDQDQAVGHFPLLTKAVAAATFAPYAGQVDGSEFTRRLAEEASERFGLEHRRAPVEAVGAGWVEVGGDRVTCGSVVLCAGAWTARLCEPVGARPPVVAQRGEIVHLRVDGASTEEWPLIMRRGVGPYVIPWPGGRLAVGATVVNQDHFDARPTLGGISGLVAGLVEETSPELLDAALVEVRVGLRPVTPDDLPLIGPVPGAPGVFVATGHGANGLSWGPYTGEVVADLVCGDPSGINLDPFRPERFVKGLRGT